MKVLFLLATLAATSLAGVDYSGWQLFQVVIGSDSDKVILENLKDNEHFIFWKEMHNEDNSAEVLVHPDEIESIQHMFKDSEVSIKIEDLSTEIDNETKENPMSRNIEEMSWDRYHSHETINGWLDSLFEKYPNITEVHDIGTTYENRTIKGIHVGFDGYKPGKKYDRGIYLEAGIHGREWITVATVTYLLNEILTNTDPEFRNAVEKYDWYIFPVVNPDGYAHSYSTDRMWRKTRTPTVNGCIGVDLNRNWNKTAMKSSDNPCSDGFPGTTPISEKETIAFSKFYEQFARNFDGYISFHSYSQLMLIPYGDSTEKRDNFDELNAAAEKMAEAIKVNHGTDYTYGNLMEVLYTALGTNVDYVKTTYGTRMTYFWELRDKGKHGFLVPAADIIASGEETKTGIVTMINQF